MEYKATGAHQSSIMCPLFIFAPELELKAKRNVMSIE